MEFTVSLPVLEWWQWALLAYVALSYVVAFVFLRLSTDKSKPMDKTVLWIFSPATVLGGIVLGLTALICRAVTGLWPWED